MKNILLSISLVTTCFLCHAQTKKVELYDLLKKLIPDSSINGTVGDWAIGKPAMYPVKWKADRIEMSDDMTINFFRTGTAAITISGKNILAENNNSWTVTLKGARSGFSSLTISSPVTSLLKPKTIIDSLLGNKSFVTTSLLSCDKNPVAGFYYYKIRLDKKGTAWIKVSWQCSQAGCSTQLDIYDDWSKQYAVVNCAK